MVEIDSGDAPAGSALQPLLRWAEPLFAAARDRSLRRWSDAALRQPDRLDFGRLQASLRSAFSAPPLALTSRTLLLELAIARHLHVLEGETPEARFRHFLDGIDSADGRRTIDTRYPLLRADVARQAEQTERFLDRFLSRVVDDHPRLGVLFHERADAGCLHAFAMGQGDRHDHGGSVLKLDFEAGLALYKPRSLALDTAYSRFVEWLSGHGVEPTQQAATTLDRGDYGWAAWVAHATVQDEDAAKRYYRRYGGLVAIAYLLNGTDLHLENVIACGEYPVPIDLETLLQPVVLRGDGHDLHGVPYAPSVLFSGLLPGQLSSVDARDISGLASAEHRYSMRSAVDAGTDQLRLAPTEAVATPGANLPRLADGRRIAPHGHANAVIDGFAATYDGLLRLKPTLRGRDGPLASFAGAQTRTVLRSTQIYARLLHALSHPQYLRSTDDRETVLARLEVGSRSWPFLARTQAAEREALLLGDVPRFMARVDGVDIHDGDGHVVNGLCDRSGLDEVRHRLRLLSPRDARRQRYALAQTLECDRLSNAAASDSASSAGARTLQPYRGGSFLDTAVSIGDELLVLSFQGRGGLALFHPEYGNRDHAAMVPMGVTLYEGMSGVALLFGELGLQSGLPRFARACDAALASCRRMLRDDPDALRSIGAYDGLSGWIYVLLTLGVRLGRDALIDEAAGWVPRLAEGIEEDRQLDLAGGVAGCLLVLLQLHRFRPDDAILAAASACASRLLDTARSDGEGVHWLSPASPDIGLTGFAHGTAGIGAALLRYGARTRHAASLAVAAQALRYERAAFEARGRRWYDRGQATGALRDTNCWCRGASGVGLARLLWPESVRDDAWRADLMHCIGTTREQGSDSGHCLCHGAMGNLELLLQQAVREHDAGLLAACRSSGQALLDSASNGWLLGAGSPLQEPLGLMTGLSGVAYGCLRLAQPAAAPAVLCLAVDTCPSA